MSPIITGVRFKMFTSNGTFVVPEGVTKIYVTGCGGGGGGCATGTGLNGSSGGSTSLGSLITLGGGGGGLNASSGTGGSAGGSGATPGVVGTPNIGGSSMFGIPGKYTPTSNMTIASGYGAGGCGSEGGGGLPVSGGGGASVLKNEITVTPGTSHSVTIGTGGSGANSNLFGLSGTSGFLLVEW